MIKISIIIPIYNGEDYIEECLQSVLRQDLKEREIICVDDGSTDSTVTIINRYMIDNPEIKLIKQSNMGAAMARNAALKIARGKYIAFMDADDTYIDESGLRRMVSACESQGVLVCGSFRSIQKDEEIIQADTHRSLFENDAVECVVLKYEDFQYDYYYQSYVFQRDFLLQNNIEFPNLRRYQDPPFFARAMTCAEKFIVLPIELYCYRARMQFFHYNFIQMNHTLEGIKMNMGFASKKGLKILFENNLNRINKDFNYRIKLSLNEGNLEAIKILLEIDEILVKNPFGICSEIEALKWIKGLLGVPKIERGKHKIPFDKVPYMSKIAIYGAGVVGKYIHSMVEFLGYYQIVKWVDKNYEKLQKEGLKVFPPEEIRQSDADYIIIAIENNMIFEEIKEELSQKGLSDNKTIIGPIEKLANENVYCE